MARHISLTGLIVLGLVFLTGTAFACSCSRPTPAQYAKWISTLIEGEIVSTRTKGRWQQTTIRVISVVKGDGSLRNQKIIVDTQLDEAACGFRFPAKGRMFVALRGGSQRFTTSWCTMGPLTTKHAKKYIDAVKAFSVAQGRPHPKRCFADYKTVNKILAFQTVADCSVALARPKLTSFERIEAYNRRKHSYIYLKGYSEAIADLTMVIKAEPRNAEHYFLRGNLYVRINMRREAIRDYRKSLQVDPSLKLSRERLKRLGINPQ